MAAGKKAPAPFDERKFALVPKRSGANYEVAEVVGFVESSSGEVKIQRWNSTARELANTTRIKKSQIIGDIPADDRRMVDIKSAIARMILDLDNEVSK